MSTAPDLSAIRPTWAEIDLRAFERNVAAIASRLPAGSRLVAVLKANAYGHGAVELARRCSGAHVAMIATALLEESLELRRAGITLPLLVLGPLTEPQVRIALEHDITLGVPGPEELEAVCRVAAERDVAIHLKLDSGMGRMGVVEGELPRVIELLRGAPRVQVAGIYTHFASAGDPHDPLTDQQRARFAAMIETLRAAGIDAPLHHSANSAATMRGLIEPGDLVRVGLALFGAEPLDEGVSRLEPVMRWRTAIARLKELPAGHAVGYGATFHTIRPSRIATIPVGYADGYDRLFSNCGTVLVRGQRVPVVGRVSMDLVTLDVTDLAEVTVGDEVVLLGGQGQDELSAEELAAKLGTISYEVLCNVSARVPRVYLDDGVVGVRSRFD
ncbi:MAG: alanine racemase [Acidobacteriota bacterium]|jgi:alanine racemase|nr:alanine racemase [Acidobacteriota bacterium]